MNDYGRYFRGERSANNLWEIIRLFLHGLIFLPIIWLQAWAVIETPFDAIVCRSFDCGYLFFCFKRKLDIKEFKRLYALFADKMDRTKRADLVILRILL